jgi:hypothetical protein
MSNIVLVFTRVGVSLSLWPDCTAQTVVLEQLYIQKAVASIPIKSFAMFCMRAL